MAIEVEVNAAEIVGYGIFEAIQVGDTAARGSSTPQGSVGNVRFVHFSNEIPAVLGTQFGFQYVLSTSPRGLVDITYVIQFPEPGLVQHNGQTHQEARYHDRVPTGRKLLHGYGFDEAREMLPGEWVFEIWHKKVRLIRKTFTVSNRFLSGFSFGTSRQTGK